MLIELIVDKEPKLEIGCCYRTKSDRRILSPNKVIKIITIDIRNRVSYRYPGEYGTLDGIFHRDIEEMLNEIILKPLREGVQYDHP